MKQLNDTEKVLLNEALISLNFLEKNKSNKEFLKDAEMRLKKVSDIGLSQDEIATEYHKFKNELWTLNKDGEGFEQTLSVKTIKKRRTYEY